METIQDITWSHMYIRFCKDKTFSVAKVTECMDISPPAHENDYDSRKCYKFLWPEDGYIYKAQICFLGKSEEDIELKIQKRLNAKSRFRFAKCIHTDSDIEEEAENESIKTKNLQKVAQKSQKEAILKTKKETDKAILQERLKNLKKTSMIDSPISSLDEGSESSELSSPETRKLQKKVKKTITAPEESENESDYGKEKTVRRQLMYSGELHETNQDIPGPSSKTSTVKVTNPHCTNHQDIPGPSSPTSDEVTNSHNQNNQDAPGPSSQTSSARVTNSQSCIANSTTKPIRRFSIASVCKNFKIDSSTLAPLNIDKSNYSERAAALPRYETFKNINREGIQIKCIHLGSGFYISFNAWELIDLESKHSLFVKYLGQALWGEEYLANSYIEKSDSITRIPERSPRKRLDSPRIGIIKQCLEDRLEEQNEKALIRLEEVRKIGHYLGEHGNSLRRRLYPHTVKKKNRSSSPRDEDEDL